MSFRGIAKFFRLKQLTSKFNFNTSHTINGKKFIIPVIKNMGLLNLSVKEDWLMEVLKKLNIPENASFVDIGVNVGQTLLTFRSLYSNTYWGFEPNPSCVFYLNSLIKTNKFKNVNILPVGLSSENALLKFYLKNEVDSAGTIIQDLRPDYYDSEQVNFVPLFSFDKLNFNEIKNISLIKIDVEGAELDVISGLIKTINKFKPKIICEILDCHSEKSIPAMQSRADKLIDLMKSNEYDVYRILHSENPIGFKKIDKLKLQVWSPESFNLNDYLFVPFNSSPLN